MAAVSSRRRALAALAVIALLTASGGVAADTPITPAQEAEARLARAANAVFDPASVQPDRSYVAKDPARFSWTRP
jgi:hypothetical protein